MIWRRRNEIIHHGTCPSFNDGVAEIRGIVNCMLRAKYSLHGPGHVANGFGRTLSNVEEGVQVFVDGAYSFGSSIVGCGGVICRAGGGVLEAFMCTVAGHSSIEAELWGCVWGLRRAWDAGYRRVQLFCDASQVVDGVKKRSFELHENGNLFDIICGLLRNNWYVKLLWIRRDDNIFADFLAKSSFNCDMSFHFLLN